MFGLLRRVATLNSPGNLLIHEAVKKVLLEMNPKKTLDIVPTSPLKDYIPDSLARMEFVLRMEDELGVEIPETKVDNLETISDVIRYLGSLS